MKVSELELSGVLLIEPPVFRDERGYFREIWQEERYGAEGIPRRFVQDNVSCSSQGVIRGLHFQNPHGQGKLISVLEGEVYDVVVDVRKGSSTFGRWVGRVLSADNGEQLYVPEGFAHGFAVLSNGAVFSYKCTDYHVPDAERTILWNDPDLQIDWPVSDPVISAKDAQAPRLADIHRDHLPG
jgi:dTDP-4-dehydrorhamnose 3,5-epimerase